MPIPTMNGEDVIRVEKSILPYNTLTMDILEMNTQISIHSDINMQRLLENVDDLKLWVIYFKILDTFFKILVKDFKI